MAAGGAAALSACVERLRPDEPIPDGDGADAHPTGQHEWNGFLRTDEAGNHQLPRHHTFLYCSLPGDGPPGSDARSTVADALDPLDEAFAWGPEGLLHSVGYSPAYFGRYDGSLPDSVDLPRPEPLAPFETPTFDEQDLLVHLASDRPDALLSAEEALTGERGSANDVEFPDALTDAVTVESRRTGFMEVGRPHEEGDDLAGVPQPNPIPEDAPLFMGFVAGLRANQATESYVTLPDGPFAGGTTKAVSNWRQRLNDWYGEQDPDQRVTEMFSPGHAAEGLVEGAGQNLGDDSGVDDVLDVVADAKEHGRVGHAQKAARANRDDEGNVKLLRRHVESTDDDEASLHFPALQRGISDFEEVRRAMNGTDAAEATPAVRQRVNNGILEYIFVRRRGYFLVPPRNLRALPRPDGSA
ncbi:Tat pathway signal protein (plasmid) [Halorarum salinum]|uniref:Tat pathway signal protein n=1 Tax=Halorarum salinum TaxID=2743089 RepID=A0A7D5QJJ4_9EURY|nr:Tat pathway signal protein [Halobaculum salinum]